MSVSATPLLVSVLVMVPNEKVTRLPAVSAVTPGFDNTGFASTVAKPPAMLVVTAAGLLTTRLSNPTKARPGSSVSWTDTPLETASGTVTVTV